MSFLPVRLWTFDVATRRHGRPVASQAELVWQRDLPLDLARMTLVNALGCDPLGVVDYQAHLLELRLLLSYVDAGPAGTPFTVRHQALRSVSGHIRRFVSEATGMGVLSGAGAHLLNWEPDPDRGNLANFDVLPARLAGQFSDRGVRPDLLFLLGERQVAGEARGRVRNGRKPLPDRPLSDQWRRLDQLAVWSRDHQDHPYFMSWTYVGPAGVAADVFFPRSSMWGRAFAAADAPSGVSVSRPESASATPRPPRHAASSRTGARGESRPADPEFEDVWAAADWEAEPAAAASDPDRQLDGGHAVVDRLEPRIVEEPSFSFARRFWRPVALGPQAWEQAAGHADEIADRLYEAAPGTVGDFRGESVRGTWATADLRGPARHRVLFALLPSRLPGIRELTAGQDSPATSAPSPRGLQVAGHGRFAVAVSPTEQPVPSWPEIETALRGRTG